MNLQEELLYNYIEEFKKKWGSKENWPVNDLDKRWWNFNTDKLKGSKLRIQAEKLTAGVVLMVDDLTEEQTEKIFESDHLT